MKPAQKEQRVIQADPVVVESAKPSQFQQANEKMTKNEPETKEVSQQPFQKEEPALTIAPVKKPEDSEWQEVRNLTKQEKIQEKKDAWVYN